MYQPIIINQALCEFWNTGWSTNQNSHYHEAYILEYKDNHIKTLQCSVLVHDSIMEKIKVENLDREDWELLTCNF